MTFKTFRDWIIVVIFLIAGVVSWNLYFKVYHQADKVNIHTFPREFGAWTSVELPVSELDMEILETRNVFIRKYTRPESSPVYVFMVYSESNRKVSHPPEICYTGSGVTVVENAPDTIVFPSGTDGVEVNKLMVEKGEDAQLVFYWFKVGDIFTANYWKQQALIAVNSFLGKPANSALIRISTDVKNDHEGAAKRLLKEFGQEFIPLLRQNIP